MSKTKKKQPAGTVVGKFSLPSETMDKLRGIAAKEGCTMTYIATQLLNAYTRGEIKLRFSTEY
ncbi:MAG: hypothetical protein ACRYFX_09925 [Janthinobacterium lividum]